MRLSSARKEPSSKIKQDLYRILQQRAVGVDTQFRFLAEVGVKIAGEGQIEFDKGRFEEAYAEDPEAVENLFAAYESTGTSTETIAPGVTVDNITTTYEELGFGDLFKQAIEKLTREIRDAHDDVKRVFIEAERSGSDAG